MTIDFSTTALLLVDLQNDFCPGGALAVKSGDEVVEPLNKLAGLFSRMGGRVIATQDWHTSNHISFASSHPDKKPGDIIKLPTVREQILWPDHCVQGTEGAKFHSKLNLDLVHLIIRKGYTWELDSYSVFYENDKKTPTGLDGFLKNLRIKTVFMGGLATDYCIFYSAMDAAYYGFETFIIWDAVRGIDYPRGSIESAIEAMKLSGIRIINSSNIERDNPS